MRKQLFAAAIAAAASSATTAHDGNKSTYISHNNASRATMPYNIGMQAL